MILLSLLSAVGCNAPSNAINVDTAIADDEACAEGAPTGNRVGQCAPDFSLVGDDGAIHSLRDARGSITFIDFSSAW